MATTLAIITAASAISLLSGTSFPTSCSPAANSSGISLVVRTGPANLPLNPMRELLIETSRFSRGSRAFHTSPLPPRRKPADVYPELHCDRKRSLDLSRDDANAAAEADKVLIF